MDRVVKVECVTYIGKERRFEVSLAFGGLV